MSNGLNNDVKFQVSSVFLSSKLPRMRSIATY